MDQVRAAFDGVTVLVTGGAGFIGSHLVEALLGHGATVRVLDDLSSGHRANVPEAAELREGSILDEAALEETVSGCRYVFHEAAMVSVPMSVERPEDCLAINVRGTQQVLEAARRHGVSRLVFAASAAAYGDEPALPCREEQPPDCRSPYAASKVAGEHLLRAYGNCYELSTVSLRYFNIFGPRQDPGSPYAAVISAFADALLGGRRPRIFGDGEQTRDFTFIDNVVEANLRAAACPRPLRGEVLNIGTGRRSSLLQVLGHMIDVLGSDLEPVMEPPRAGDVRHSVADVAEARRVIGYEPAVGLAEGLEQLLRWASASR